MAQSMGVAANVGEYVHRHLLTESGGEPVERHRFLDTLKVLQVLIESGTNGMDGLPNTNLGSLVAGTDAVRSPVKKPARLKGKSSSAVSSASASTTASSEPERNASARVVDSAVASAMFRSPHDLMNRSTGLRVYNPSFDSSNFMAALEGGEPNAHEIFIQEQGNSFFSVGGQQLTVGQEVYTPSPPKAPRPSSAARPRKAPSGGKGSRPSSASPAIRGGGSRPQGPPAAASCPSSPATPQSMAAAFQSPLLMSAAGKPSHELAVCVSAVTGHRNAHILAAPQDGPRGRGARNAAITCKDHCGRIAQDLCSASAGTVAGSLIHPRPS